MNVVHLTPLHHLTLFLNCYLFLFTLTLPSFSCFSKQKPISRRKRPKKAFDCIVLSLISSSQAFVWFFNVNGFLCFSSLVIKNGKVVESYKTINLGLNMSVISFLLLFAKDFGHCFYQFQVIWQCLKNRHHNNKSHNNAHKTMRMGKNAENQKRTHKHRWQTL